MNGPEPTLWPWLTPRSRRRVLVLLTRVVAKRLERSRTPASEMVAASVAIPRQREEGAGDARRGMAV